jgi:hypothetical protein
MSISCDCSGDIDNPSSVESFTDRRARKPHTCDECREIIQPGAHYEYASGCWDGRWSHFKTCAPCSAIAKRYCPRGGYPFGGLADHLRECLGFDYRIVPEDES